MKRKFECPKCREVRILDEFDFPKTDTLQQISQQIISPKNITGFRNGLPYCEKDELYLFCVDAD